MTPKEAELFIRNISHEIKNPLTTIKGYAQLLKLKGSDPVFAEKACSLISGQVQRIEDSFSGFYSLFSLPVSEPCSFAIVPMIRDLADGFPPESKLSLQFSCPEDLSVAADRDAVTRSILLIAEGFRWKDFPEASFSIAVSSSSEGAVLSLDFGLPLFSFLDNNSFLMPFASGHLFATGLELFSSHYILSRSGISFTLNAGRDGFTVTL